MQIIIFYVFVINCQSHLEQSTQYHIMSKNWDIIFHPNVKIYADLPRAAPQCKICENLYQHWYYISFLIIILNVTQQPLLYCYYYFYYFIKFFTQKGQFQANYFGRRRLTSNKSVRSEVCGLFRITKDIVLERHDVVSMYILKHWATQTTFHSPSLYWFGSRGFWGRFKKEIITK